MKVQWGLRRYVCVHGRSIPGYVLGFPGENVCQDLLEFVITDGRLLLTNTLGSQRTRCHTGGSSMVVFYGGSHLGHSPWDDIMCLSGSERANNHTVGKQSLDQKQPSE